MSTKREKELARLRAERQSVRRAEAADARRQRTVLVAGAAAVALVVAVVAVLVLNGRDDDADDTLAAPPATPTTPTEATPAGTCVYPAGGEAAKEAPTPPAEPLTGPASVLLATSQGDITLALATDAAPCTTSSFRTLVDAGYYDDTPCHRLTTEGIFVLQCGDPTGTGSGGPGYSFANENLEGATYPRGTLAMANAGPDTNGSQFFLVYADTQLPPEYTPFGTIDEAGLAVVDAVAETGVEGGAGDGAPATPVQIEDASLVS